MAFKSAVALVTLALLPVSISPAQTAGVPATASVQGVVRGEMSIVLPDADVFLNTDSLRTRSNANGRFRFDRIAEGTYWLFVRRIGYSATRRLINVKAGENVELTIRLSPLPVILPDIDVRAESDKDLRRMMAGTRNAWGRSLNEEDILRYGAMGLSVIVRQDLPFQAVSHWDRMRRSARATSTPNRTGSGGSTGGRQAGRAQSPGGVPRPTGLGEGCAPAVSVNGEQPWTETMVDDFPADVVASMEIYKPKRRGGHVPADFSFIAQAINCGLVVIWLR